ncbi:MAG TPA: DUF2272 domain-containing protein [Luteimonas sp.]|nr:DUF2272 domain-containing protein [Luteimonas sp.]
MSTRTRSWLLAGLLLLPAALLLPSMPALAADPCSGFGRGLGSMQYAERIAAVACQESTLWHRPFVDASGGLMGAKVMEGEGGLLADRVTPAWQRVATYWRHPGLLGVASGAGAQDCGAMPGDRLRAASCRAFVLDQPWSAAFVSFVMARAGVPGFRSSGSHSSYVREAYRAPARSPYLFADPATTPAGIGDLLCFARSEQRLYGHAGLAAFFASAAGDGGLEMHCDVVVGTGGTDGRISLVGGNVMHAVTLRQLPVNAAGLPSAWPTRTLDGPACSPEQPTACDLNRQDWGVLLKLKSLPAATAPMAPLPTGFAPQPACCTACVVGAVPAIPRCPVPPPTP